MPTSLPILEEVGIRTNCQIPWDEMQGTDRTRFCSVCHKSVHNLSAMTRTEVEEFLAAKEEPLCIRFYRRPDGTLVTQDCAEFSQQVRKRWGHRMLCALASWLGLSLVGGCDSPCNPLVSQGKAPPEPELYRSGPLDQIENPVNPRQPLEAPRPDGLSGQ